MALKDTRGGREFDKFVADPAGDTAIRTQATATSATVETTGGTIASPVTVAATSGVGTEILGPTSVAGHDRISLQFFWAAIAAGTTIGGDGENARNLANIQNNLVFDGVSIDPAGSGTFTFDDFYNLISFKFF